MSQDKGICLVDSMYLPYKNEAGLDARTVHDGHDIVDLTLGERRAGSLRRRACQLWNV